MEKVPNMGMRLDRTNRVRLARVYNEALRSKVQSARNSIFVEFLSVSSASGVEAHLSETSTVPVDVSSSLSVHAILCVDMTSIKGAFWKLAEFSFNIFDTLVTDLMHEMELGVWKALFLHLLRLLDAANVNLAHELDKRYIFTFFSPVENEVDLWPCRYRQVPTFGKDSIRRFTNNVSETKQFAARDYEDLLQVLIPGRVVMIFANFSPFSVRFRLLKDFFLTDTTTSGS